MRYAGRLVCGVVLVGLAACHRPPPPAPPVALEPPPVMQHPKQPGPVNASWSFSIMQSACVAHAVNREASLMLRFGSNGKFEFVFSSPSLRSAARHAGVHGRLQFHGGAGSWTWSARTTTHRTLSGLLPANQSAANDVMIALGGGALRTELVHARVPLLRIPAANVAGRDWFECVRAKIGHASLTRS